MPEKDGAISACFANMCLAEFFERTRIEACLLRELKNSREWPPEEKPRELGFTSSYYGHLYRDPKKRVTQRITMKALDAILENVVEDLPPDGLFVQKYQVLPEKGYTEKLERRKHGILVACKAGPRRMSELAAAGEIRGKISECSVTGFMNITLALRDQQAYGAVTRLLKAGKFGAHTGYIRSLRTLLESRAGDPTFKWDIAIVQSTLQNWGNHKKWYGGPQMDSPLPWELPEYTPKHPSKVCPREAPQETPEQKDAPASPPESPKSMDTLGTTTDTPPKQSVLAGRPGAIQERAAAQKFLEKSNGSSLEPEESPKKGPKKGPTPPKEQLGAEIRRLSEDVENMERMEEEIRSRREQLSWKILGMRTLLTLDETVLTEAIRIIQEKSLGD